MPSYRVQVLTQGVLVVEAPSPSEAESVARTEVSKSGARIFAFRCQAHCLGEVETHSLNVDPVRQEQSVRAG